MARRLPPATGMDGDATTNTLLLWLVIVTALTPLLIAGGALAMYVAWRRLMTRLDRDIAPVLAEATAVTADARHVVHMARVRLDELDKGVTMARTAAGWATSGVAGGLRAAARGLGVLARQHPRTASSTAAEGRS